MASSKPQNDLPNVYSYALAAVALAIAFQTHGTITTTWSNLPRDVEHKPHTDLLSFYEFYLQEHRDPTCRMLHWGGTTLASLAIWKNGLVPHLLVGISGGLMACEFLSPLPHGFVEFAGVFVLTFLSFHLQTRQRSFPWYVLLIGYGPAWIGHFFFEHNRPATFIYPSYSLLSDYRMWFQIVAGKLPLNERL